MPKGAKYGGRQKGTKNRRTERLDKAIENLRISPLEYMLQVMENTKVRVELRCEMAKSAAPYLHAKRAAEDRAGKTVPPMIYVTPNLESAE